MKSESERLSPLSSRCCIYRVSKRLRHVSEKAYTPQVVSIGPLHHGKESLHAMEEHKMQFLWAYINRTNTSLEQYIGIVRDNEQKVRSGYAESLLFTSDELVKMVLVDATFIIEILFRYNFEEFQDVHDRIFNTPLAIISVIAAVLLLVLTAIQTVCSVISVIDDKSP